MANPQHVAVLKEGIEQLNEWRRRNHPADMDLNGANLAGANLRKAWLSGANLGGTDLRNADLSGAHLTRTFAFGADLRGAHLVDADLRGAHLVRSRPPRG